MVVGFILASCRWHILDSETGRDFRVDLVLAAIGALDDLIVVSIVDLIVGSATSTLVSALSLFRFFLCSVVYRSAVAGTIIYMPLISFAATLQEDGKVMEHCLFLNIVVCPPKSKWLINRRETRKVEVWRAST